MACIDYIKSFYNDAYFKTEAYAHILIDVISMCNKMILTTYTKNTEVLNEILELYRLLVEKYSDSSSYAQIAQLAHFLSTIWNYFIEMQK